jgi:hypothetical protein
VPFNGDAFAVPPSVWAATLVGLFGAVAGAMAVV